MNSKKPTSPRRARSLAMAFWFALIGLAVEIYVVLSPDDLGEVWRNFYLYSTAAGFVTAYGIWYLLVAKKPGKWRGLFAGGIIGILSHTVCWYFFTATYYIYYLLFRTEIPGSTLAVPPPSLGEDFWIAIYFSFLSLIITGWATVGGGSALGFFLGSKQARKQS